MQITYKLKRVVPYQTFYKILARVIMPKKNHAASRNIFIRESLKLSKETFISWFNYTMEILHSEEIVEQLKKIAIKIYFISGSEDRCFLSGTKKTVKAIHNCNFKIINNCGHVCSIEKANEFNQCALHFLAQPIIA